MDENLKGVWRVMPCGERLHVNALQPAAAASPFSGSARSCTICPVRQTGDSSNRITGTENTDQRSATQAEKAWQGNRRRAKWVRVVHLFSPVSGGGERGKMVMFDLPSFGVLLTRIAFQVTTTSRMSRNVCQCQRSKPGQEAQDPVDHYAAIFSTLFAIILKL